VRVCNSSGWITDIYETILKKIIKILNSLPIACRKLAFLIVHGYVSFHSPEQISTESNIFFFCDRQSMSGSADIEAVSKERSLFIQDDANGVDRADVLPFSIYGSTIYEVFSKNRNKTEDEENRSLI